MLKIITHTNEEILVENGTIGGKPSDTDIIASGKNGYHVIRNGKSYSVTVAKADWNNKTITLRINGKKHVMRVKDKYDEILEKLGMGGQAKIVKDIKAPMPGKVLEVLVKGGEAVQKEQALLVLEAMKMENVIKSPGEGVIKSIVVNKGNTVEKNQVMIHFEKT